MAARSYLRQQSVGIVRAMATPPEVFQSHRYTTAGDVYQFGVLLLECVAGEQVAGEVGELGGGTLALAATRALLTDHERVVELLPASLPVAGKEVVQVQALGELIHACLAHAPASRPTMVQVVQSLEHILGYGEEQEHVGGQGDARQHGDDPNVEHARNGREGVVVDLEDPWGGDTKLLERDEVHVGMEEKHVGEEGRQRGREVAGSRGYNDGRLGEQSISPIELSLLLPSQQKV